jgi:hypothetical protein
MRKYESDTNMLFIAVCVVYTILYDMEKRLQENRKRQFSGKSARKIFHLVAYMSNLVDWIDWVAITHNGKLYGIVLP